MFNFYFHHFSRLSQSPRQQGSGYRHHCRLDSRESATDRQDSQQQISRWPVNILRAARLDCHHIPHELFVRQWISIQCLG